ncbi:MAG: porin family protein [Gammaproteobacteria bacterium]|nr:porin family protein [Gammaproteobacteria bacterium]
MKKNVLVSMVLAASIGSMSVNAKEPIYIGGGLGLNSLTGFDDATGFQFFGGYELGDMGAKGFNFAVEAGYMDSGEFERSTTIPFLGTVTVATEAKGIWATGVAAYAASPTVDLLARLGLDFGDDDGLMIGIGIGFDVNKQMQLRGEFVTRDNVDSLQFNVVYHLN